MAALLDGQEEPEATDESQGSSSVQGSDGEDDSEPRKNEFEAPERLGDLRIAGAALLAAMWRSGVTGVVSTLVAVLLTVVYLASIEIDDGLEALLFLPVLALTTFVGATFVSRRGSRSGWAPGVLGVIVGATATAVVGLVAVVIESGGGNFVPVSSIARVVALFAGVGASAGWFVGWALRLRGPDGERLG